MVVPGTDPGSGADSPRTSTKAPQIDIERETETASMCAQLITTRLKPGKEGKLPELIEQLRVIEQRGSGLLRSTAMLDQNDPSRVFMLVVFESEEKARAREQDPQRQEGLETARANMSEIFEGAPDFVDLTVVDEVTP